MPAHSINLQDPGAVLRILLTLIESSPDHEVRFKAVDYDGIDKAKLMVIDFDRRKGEIVIRATSNNGTVVQVTPEAHAWSAPPNLAPQERARLRAEELTAKRSVPSDEDLARMEETAQAQRSLALDLEEGKSPLRINLRK